MQPEPAAHSTDAFYTDPPARKHSPSQHGCLDCPPDASGPATLPAGSETGPAATQVALDAAFAASLQRDDKKPASPQRRLSTRNSPSPPAYNRIAAYENALSPSPKKKGGPAFEVIKKARSPGDQRSPIQELPNEVLTHSLAHLQPSDLASMALVCKRFHDLVNGPHAWRSAFAHYFPGSQSLDQALYDDESDDASVVRTEKRAFTRLTALASWRSEYIIRTRLLRSLARGKPAQASNTSSTQRNNVILPLVMYKSQLQTTVNRLHATFDSGNNKKQPRFIHGADDIGMATTSDPAALKVDNWGLSDPQFFLQFTDRFAGDAQYGLGPGEIVGVPNPMDVSQPYGMLYGEGFPGGKAYFRALDEMRGRYLAGPSTLSAPRLGMPRLIASADAVTSLWLAKAPSIPSISDGLVGILCGSSLGVLTAYSLGTPTGGNKREHRRFDRGEITAKWVLSPGVPIIAIAVDNEYSPARHAQNRIWAVVLNALGEIFYLTKFPRRASGESLPVDKESALEQRAWITGRSVNWKIAEPSRRKARLDPYADANVDASYSPRSSWTGMCLAPDQIEAETQEIEAFTLRKPKDFIKTCLGWDMRRKLEVDFAGDDDSHAGESAIVFQCGLDENADVAIRRYTRFRVRERSMVDELSTPPLTSASTEPSSPPSLFGAAQSPALSPTANITLDRLEDSLSLGGVADSSTPRPMVEEWRCTDYSLGGVKSVQILTTAIDHSNFAKQTLSEDHLLNFSGRSTASSPSLTPQSPASRANAGISDVPGQRARLFAIGTKLGTVMVWDARAPGPRTADSVNTIEPVRIIHTESPEISSLALSSLYLVHGGNDGLVQTWDPLGSTLHPIRTLHSRFSSRARRDLARANATPQGVGINLYAAGAICLDPDPTVLRGMVSLGNQLRYWTYSSSAADQFKSSKRRLRHGERGSNSVTDRMGGVVRTNLKNYIAHERHELDREKQQRQKDSERFAGRFGTELLDGSEEELLAYAAMLSQESLEQETLRRGSDTSTSTSVALSSVDQSVWDGTAQATPSQMASPVLGAAKSDDELDADIAEAIRQSLAAASPSRAAFDIPIRTAKAKGRKGSSAKNSPRPSPLLSGSSKAAEMSDLEFALQLSLAEEASKQDGLEPEAFPSLASPGGKGKTRMYY